MTIGFQSSFRWLSLVWQRPSPQPSPRGRGGQNSLLSNGFWERGERFALGTLLVATFAVRAIHPDQPIVENYVGRQIPTAMVARNLERGSGFFFPQLDTGPFPNLFLVEPPIYAGLVVLVRPVLGFDWERTGRLVSAAATALGAWGLFGLARRREGVVVALIAVASFGIFPVMVRFGRAFQPDALMVGFVLAGLRGWDEFAADGRKRWGWFGGFVLAAGLAVKVTSAWVLIPFALILTAWPLTWRMSVSCAMLIPALLWYGYAWGQVDRPAAGSLASSDNAVIWIRSLSPTAWLRFSIWATLGRSLVVGAFTPVGFGLAALGSFFPRGLDRLWVGWAIACGLSILILATKWHHGYYWMVVAPLAAVGVARSLVGLWDRGRSGRAIAVALGSFFLALSVVQSAGTYRTPLEWAGVVEVGRELAATTDENELVIAPEAVLYYADRRGFRLEFDPMAARRAAGEWGFPLTNPDAPLALVEFYTSQGHELAFGGNGFYTPAFAVADIGPITNDPRRLAWRASIRARPETTIVIDRPDAFVAKLTADR